MSASVLAALLVRTLTDYARQCRRDGLPVPPEVDVLLRALGPLLTAPTGHNWPDLAAYSAHLGSPDDRVAMTYAQAAELLEVSHRTVRRLVERGVLRTAGRRVLSADVAAYARKGAA